jgi:LuxR family transcriptional regulator, maltose regulon positive regulatory protein
MEEVLQQQPGEIRRFLLETSILEKLSGDLCDAVTGGTRGQEILAKLESGSLFTVPLDLPHAWYRYEHLFAELLRHELKTEHGDERVAGLHRRASEWFEKHALPEDAIHHALSARDWAGALRLIVAVNPIATYGGFTTYNWLHNIPPEALSTNPSAWINYAWALAMTGRVKAALEFMDTGEKSIGYYTKIKCYLDVVRTYIYSLQLDPRAEECAREALLRLPPGDGVNHMTVSSMLGGYYLRSGRYKDAEPLIAEAGEFYQRAGNAVDAANSLTSLALIMLLRGKLRQAEEMFQRAIDIGGGHPNAGYAQVYLEVLHYQRNELEKAAEDHGKALLENPGSSELRGTVDLYLVLLHLTRGDTEGAAAALKKAEQSMITDESTVMDRARIAAQHVAVAAAMDDSEATNHWLDELEKYEGIFIYDAPTIAMHLLYSRQGPAIKEKLQAEYERLQREDLKLYMIMMRLHQALIASQPGEALALLAEAMAMGQPEGIIRAFTDFGMSLDPLLRKAIGAGTEPDYARQLLTIIEEEEHRRKVRKGEIPASSRGAALLTLREIELVRLMAKGYSNQQIAKELVISLSTTKNHVHNILDKLNARSRTQAIVQARQLGLI